MSRQDEGTIIDDKFRVVSVLGRGAFGVVYLAEQAEFNRLVALKVITEKPSDAVEATGRFQREVRILSTLDHENIVGVYSCGYTASGQPYVCMQHLEGRTLDSVLAQEKFLGWKRTVTIGIQICRALQAAHREGIIHRDLKPQNIMLVDDDVVKVLDFGLAGLTSSTPIPHQKLTHTGALIGSVHYMSPELCRGKKPDERSDIYAVGCVLYQCLMGRLPLDAPESIAVIFKQATELPERLTDKSAPQAIPEALERIIFKALQKDPQNRFQSMSEFEKQLQLLDNGLQDEVLLESVEMPAYAKPAQPAPQRATSIAIGTAACVSIAVACLYVYNSEQTVQHAEPSADSHADPSVRVIAVGVAEPPGELEKAMAGLHEEKDRFEFYRRAVNDDNLLSRAANYQEQLVMALRNIAEYEQSNSDHPYLELLTVAVKRLEPHWAPTKQLEWKVILNHIRLHSVMKPRMVIENCRRTRETLEHELKIPNRYIEIADTYSLEGRAELALGNKPQAVALQQTAVRTLIDHPDDRPNWREQLITEQLALAITLSVVGGPDALREAGEQAEAAAQRLDWIGLAAPTLAHTCRTFVKFAKHNTVPPRMLQAAERIERKLTPAAPP